MREETAPIKKLATFALVEGATLADMNCNEEVQLGDSGANDPDSSIATITSFLTFAALFTPAMTLRSACKIEIKATRVSRAIDAGEMFYPHHPQIPGDINEDRCNVGCSKI